MRKFWFYTGRHRPDANDFQVRELKCASHTRAIELVALGHSRRVGEEDKCVDYVSEPPKILGIDELVEHYDGRIQVA